MDYFRSIVLFLVLGVCILGSAIPSKDEHSKRVKEHHVSDHDHYDSEGEHNPDYDHDAFLGEDEAREFDKLPPEESKRRLGLIYEKIDAGKDNLVDKEELTKWIQHVQNKYLEHDAKRQWDELVVDGPHLTWEHYRQKSYGGLDDDEGDNEDEDMNHEDNEDMKDTIKMARRDKKRFERADRDGDGNLNSLEFAEFIHPEESKDMKDLVAEETMEDIDKNGDGYIDLEEYVGDLWTPGEGEKEPDWVQRERDNFKERRDTNKDGHMDKEEVMAWIMPDDYDHIQIEAKHLMKEADTNKDGFLSKEEVLEKHDVFAGSQATDYGDAIARHDEF